MADGDGSNKEGKDGKGNVMRRRVPVKEEGEGGTGHGVGNKAGIL